MSENITRSELNALLARQNPLNLLKSSWFILVAVVGGAGYVFNMQSDIRKNTESIERVNVNVQKELESISNKLTDQSNRFELYLESLRSVRDSNESDLDYVREQVSTLKERILLLENK